VDNRELSLDVNSDSESKAPPVKEGDIGGGDTSKNDPSVGSLAGKLLLDNSQNTASLVGVAGHGGLDLLRVVVGEPHGLHIRQSLIPGYLGAGNTHLSKVGTLSGGLVEHPLLNQSLVLDGLGPELVLGVVLLEDVKDDSNGLPEDKVSVGVVDNCRDTSVRVEVLEEGGLHSVGSISEVEENGLVG
jgi:hypothetical protein